MAMIQRVEFVSQKVAERIKPSGDWGLISIVDVFSPHSKLAYVDSGWRSILRLRFDDVDSDKDGFQVFSSTDAKNTIKWLFANEECLDTVFVHCYAGISRSAGVAKFVADMYRITDFPHHYTLYNKMVYSTLLNEYYKRLNG
jgi:predicted protein tyrosine phosphatase